MGGAHAQYTNQYEKVSWGALLSVKRGSFLIHRCLAKLAIVSVPCLMRSGGSVGSKKSTEELAGDFNDIEEYMKRDHASVESKCCVPAQVTCGLLH
jgi:hypothetical protein